MNQIEQVNLIDEIQKIVARETSNCGSGNEEVRIDESIAGLLGENSGTILERLHQELAIQIRYGEGPRKLADDLTWMRDLEISAAPEVVALLPITNGYVLVSRYWACPGERLISAQTTNVKFQTDACPRFRRDMEVLADHGKMHPFAGRGFAHLFVGEQTGTIVMNAWSVLKPCSPRERSSLSRSTSCSQSARPRQESVERINLVEEVKKIVAREQRFGT